MESLSLEEIEGGYTIDVGEYPTTFEMHQADAGLSLIRRLISSFSSPQELDPTDLYQHIPVATLQGAGTTREKFKTVVRTPIAIARRKYTPLETIQLGFSWDMLVSMGLRGRICHCWGLRALLEAYKPNIRQLSQADIEACDFALARFSTEELVRNGIEFHDLEALGSRSSATLKGLFSYMSGTAQWRAYAGEHNAADAATSAASRFAPLARRSTYVEDEEFDTVV